MKTGFAIATLAVIATLPLCAGAEPPRRVEVNGMVLNKSQLAWFDREQCLLTPDGSYWWNPQGGEWGYAGEAAVQGFVGEHCRDAARTPAQTRAAQTRGSSARQSPPATVISLR